MIIKQLEDNLRIAEAEGDIWSIVCIKRSIDFMLRRQKENFNLEPHIKRADKLFLRDQPSNIDYYLVKSAGEKQ